MAATIAPLGPSPNRADPGSSGQDTAQSAAGFQALLDGSSPQGGAGGSVQPKARTGPHTSRVTMADSAALAGPGHAPVRPVAVTGRRNAAGQSPLQALEPLAAGNVIGVADAPTLPPPAVAALAQGTSLQPSVQAAAAQVAALAAPAEPTVAEAGEAKNPRASKHDSPNTGSQPGPLPVAPDPAITAAAQQVASQQAAAQQTAVQIAAQQVIAQAAAVPPNVAPDAQAGLAPVSGRERMAAGPPKPTLHLLLPTPPALPSSAAPTTAQSQSRDDPPRQENDAGSEAAQTTSSSAASQPDLGQVTKLAEASAPVTTAPQAEFDQTVSGTNTGASVAKAIGDKLTTDEPASHLGGSADPSAALNAMVQTRAASPPTPTPAVVATLGSLPSQQLADARNMVALRIVHAVRDGDQTVSIDLHPAELGHVGVELSFHNDGVSVQMTISRQDTFDSFSRDRGALEQQLTQAGLNLGSGGLDLRFGQSQSQSGFFGQAVPARITVRQQTASLAAPVSQIHVSNNLLDILA